MGQVRAGMMRRASLGAFVGLLLALGLAPSAVAQQAVSPVAVSVTPPVLLADGTSHPAVYVQLVDSEGEPMVATADVFVALASTNPFIVDVPPSVRIPAGSSYAITTLATTDIAGTAAISAAVAGSPSASSKVSTVYGVDMRRPYWLTLHAAPKTMIMGGEPAGKLSVVLTDATGRLLPAPVTLSVELRSSAPGVVDVRSQVTIPQGTAYVTTDLDPLDVGIATLSAVSSGFSSKFIEVQVVEQEGIPDALRLYLSPPLLGLRTDGHQGIIIQAVDDKGVPTAFPCAEVSLASSLPEAVEVLPLARFACDGNTQYAIGTLRTGHLPGTASITVTAAGLKPTAADLLIQGHLPAQLRAYTAPGRILAADQAPGAIVVQVLDTNSIPVRSHSGIPLTLVGDPGLVPGSMVIPPGSSYVTMELSGPRTGEEVDLWVVAPSLIPANIQIGSTTLPATVNVTLESLRLFPEDESEVLVRVTSAGDPVAGADIEWIAKGGTLSDTQAVTDGNGEARALFTARAVGNGSVWVQVTKAGYTAATAQSPIGVLEVGESRGPGSATLLEISAILLFVALVIVLTAYVGHVAWPIIRAMNAYRSHAGAS